MFDKMTQGSYPKSPLKKSKEEFLQAKKNDISCLGTLLNSMLEENGFINKYPTMQNFFEVCKSAESIEQLFDGESVVLFHAFDAVF